MRQRMIPVYLILLLGFGTSAEASRIQQVSLRDALVRGMERNNLVRSALHEAAAARAESAAAAYHYLPRISLEERFTAANTPTQTFMMKLDQGRFTANDFQINNLNNPAVNTDFRTAVTIEQPLLVPTAWARRNVARHSAELRQAHSESTRQQIAFLIFQQFLDVQRTQAVRKAAEQNLAEARESMRLASVRTSAGLGLKSDELRAGTHLAALEQQLLAADHAQTLARMHLALAIGEPPGTEVDTDGLNTLPETKLAPAELVELALQHRSDLLAASQGREQAEAALTLARSAWLPSLTASATWQMNDRNSPFGREHDSWMAGAALSWTIFDRLQNWHGTAAARASRAAAGELLENTRRQIAFQVHEAYLKQREARKHLDVARTSVAAAQETVRLVSRRFENSLATIVEMLDAQNALSSARTALAEYELAYALAIGKLYHAAGIFVKEALQ